MNRDPYDWHEAASCAQSGGDAWFPHLGEHAKEAIAICAACPVKRQCLEEALEVLPYNDFGIRAGTTPGQRWTMRKEAAAT